MLLFEGVVFFELRNRRGGVFLYLKKCYIYYQFNMEKLTRYLQDTMAEMKHVKWPTSTQAAIYTVLVVIISAVVALILSGFDYLFTGLLELAV